MPRPIFLVALVLTAVAVPLAIHFELIPERWLMAGSTSAGHSSPTGPCSEAMSFLEGDPSKALSLIEACIEQNGDKTPIDIHFKRAFNFEDKIPTEKVIADYTKCIESGHKLASSYNNRALAYKKSEQYALAEKDAYNSIEHSPQIASHYWTLGSILYGNEKFRDALKYLSIALKLDPENGSVHHSMSVAYRSLNEFGKAKQEINKAISIIPDSSKYYYSRGWLNMKMNMHGAAILDYKRALQLDPKNAQAHRGLAACYFKLGKTELSQLHTKIADSMPN
ncbi:tetratricopeptide repeat protein [Desulfovibrio ferrophilus]|uniref:Uncharacterized protein n=1 Tax=Desulfovibrio ferrophilus TaxID=241368 RepID=A0A2Z6AUY3_9BACT|nr:tetratricopeptide repeat protein [Desulfovibrio ferrophilus]BBD07041.1 uncharacterized protein DFE_0315 [Desulfovibrio ferrophilus]